MVNTNHQKTHNYWMVAYLDILGQTEAMKDIDYVPIDDMDEDKKRRFEAGVRQVYGATQILHDTIENWVAKSKITPPPFQDLKDEERKFWEAKHGRPLRWQRFSDGLIAYASLVDPMFDSPLRPIYFLIGGCAAAMLLLLANNTPIRGGIATGAGCEFRPNELYGPVLARAHKLESDIAEYPRMVLDQRTHEYLVRIHQSTGGGKRGDFDRTVAGHCLDLVCVDVDGHIVVDFLGSGFRLQTGLSKSSDIFKKIRDFLDKEYNKFRKDKNTILAFRYAHLLNYFSWRIEEEDTNSNKKVQPTS